MAFIIAILDLSAFKTWGLKDPQKWLDFLFKKYSIYIFITKWFSQLATDLLLLQLKASHAKQMSLLYVVFIFSRAKLLKSLLYICLWKRWGNMTREEDSHNSCFNTPPSLDTSSSNTVHLQHKLPGIKDGLEVVLYHHVFEKDFSIHVNNWTHH